MPLGRLPAMTCLPSGAGRLCSLCPAATIQGCPGPSLAALALGWAAAPEVSLLCPAHAEAPLGSAHAHCPPLLHAQGTTDCHLLSRCWKRSPTWLGRPGWPRGGPMPTPTTPTPPPRATWPAWPAARAPTPPAPPWEPSRSPACATATTSRSAAWCLNGQLVADKAGWVGLGRAGQRVMPSHYTSRPAVSDIVGRRPTMLT